MLVKFWDLETRHCFKTLVNHRSEVNDLLLLKEESRLITGCHDNELRVFELNYLKEETMTNGDTSKMNNVVEPNEKKSKKGGLKVKRKSINNNNEDEDEEVEEEEEEDEEEENGDDDYNQLLECKLIGSLIRESKDPLSQLCVDSTHSLFSSHSSSEKHVEFYKINTPEEIKKRLAKRLKKQKKRKLAANSQLQDKIVEDEDEELTVEQTVSDEFTKIAQLKSKHKVKYVDLICEMSKANAAEDADDDGDVDENSKSATIKSLFHCKIVCLLNNNQLEIYNLSVTKQINEIKDPQLAFSLSTPAHRTDVRAIAFSASNDSSSFVTASGDSMKVWNRMSLKCIRTFECGDYILCSLYLADENHVLLGSKTGKIHLYNINTATLLELAQAHAEDTALWSMCLNMDKVSEFFPSSSSLK